MELVINYTFPLTIEELRNASMMRVAYDFPEGGVKGDKYPANLCCLLLFALFLSFVDFCSLPIYPCPA